MPAKDTPGAVLLSVLSGLPFTDPDYGQWWAGEDGQWLYSEICQRIGVPLGISSGRNWGVFYEPEDIANTAVEILRDQKLQPYLHAANEPWGYLASMLKRRLGKDAGMHLRVELNDETLRGNHYVIETDSPSMAEAVQKSFEDLRPHLDISRHKDLLEAVWYFAERGHVRLSHLYSTAARDPELLGAGWQRREVLAIANALLGSRPEHCHNSLLAGHLSSSAFEPQSSIPHRLALNKFHKRITLPSTTSLASAA